MLKLLSFRGHTGRIAWLVQIVGIFSLLITAVTFPAKSSIQGEDVSPLVVSIVLILSVWMVWASTARRLRDLGASHPVLEAMFSLLFFGFGWLWLFVRCAFFPSVSPKPQQLDAQTVTESYQYDWDEEDDEDDDVYDYQPIPAAIKIPSRPSKPKPQPKRNATPTVRRMR